MTTPAEKILDLWRTERLSALDAIRETAIALRFWIDKQPDPAPLRAAAVSVFANLMMEPLSEKANGQLRNSTPTGDPSGTRIKRRRTRVAK